MREHEIKVPGRKQGRNTGQFTLNPVCGLPLSIQLFKKLLCLMSAFYWNLLGAPAVRKPGLLLKLKCNWLATLDTLYTNATDTGESISDSKGLGVGMYRWRWTQARQGNIGQVDFSQALRDGCALHSQAGGKASRGQSSLQNAEKADCA